MTNEQIAQKLFSAYKKGELTENFSEDDSVKTLDEAYRIQQLFMQKRITELGEKIAGAKAGATGKAAMSAMNLKEPFFAPLTDRDFFIGDLSLEKCPGLSLVELEIAFKTTEDISKDADEEEIINKTNIALSVEIPTRRTIKPEKIHNLIADMGCSGNVFCSSEFIKTPDLKSLENFEGKVMLNGKVLAQGISANVLGNPVNAVIFANRMMNKLYSPIKKGMIIISGSLTAPLVISKGTYKFEIKGLGTASFSVLD